MIGEHDISDSELHAFIDGELDPKRRKAVEDVIGSDPDLAERVAAFHSDKAMLKRAYAHAAGRPLPQEWLDMTEAAKSARTVSWRLVGTIAAALAIGVLGTLEFQQLAPRGTSEIVQAALDARTTGDGEAVAIPNGADTHRYDGQVSAALALPLKVPDMRRLGYHLVALRLYPHADGSGAAELVYRGTENQLFTLYLRRSDGKTRFDQFERDGLRVCVWQDEVIGTVMAGNVSTAAMQRLASLAYTGLTS
jgi:anti-sigma factor RsiW